MEICLLRGLTVDPYNVPDDFEDQVKQIFSEYTEGTVDDYTFQDKLCFIDQCIHHFHGNIYPDDAVMNLMKDRFEYEVNNNGEFPDEDYFLTVEFMEDCYNAGKESQRMYSHDYPNCDRHDEEAIEKALIRIIKAVLEYGNE